MGLDKCSVRAGPGAPAVQSSRQPKLAMRREREGRKRRDRQEDPPMAGHFRSGGCGVASDRAKPGELRRRPGCGTVSVKAGAVSGKPGRIGHTVHAPACVGGRMRTPRDVHLPVP